MHSFILIILTTLSRAELLSRDIYGRIRTQPRFKRGLEFSADFCTDISGCDNTKKVMELLRGYDKRVRPYLGCGNDSSIEVEIDIKVLGIGHVDEVNMDYRTDILLTQRWLDPRLSNDLRADIDVPQSLMKQIWIPDSYFVNAKQANGHKVTVPNTVLKLGPYGNVMYSTRLAVHASCQMDFQLYPGDTQECSLMVESFSLTSEHVRYRWRNNNSGKISTHARLNMVEQNVTKITMVETITQYEHGNWSTAKVIFTFERYLDSFIVRIYFPCAFVVALSWASLFIPKHRVGARIKLCVVSALTTSSVLGQCFHMVPTVSYVKLVDIYLIVSVMFVYAVFGEFTLVLWLTKREMKRAEETHSMKENHDKKQRGITWERELRHGHEGEEGILMAHLSRENDPRQKDCWAQDFSAFDDGDIDDEEYPNDDEDRESHSLANTHHAYFFGKIRISLIDESARIVFPFGYLFFNILYWWLYCEFTAN